jgi:hypothetical protein
VSNAEPLNREEAKIVAKRRKKAKSATKKARKKAKK